jgi:hypothetical protein
MLKADTIKFKLKARTILAGLKKNPKKQKRLEDILARKAKELDKELRENGFEDIADISEELIDTYLDDLKDKYL